MSEDVIRWINEIKALKQQLTIAQQERDQARIQEEKWRQLYAQEAQQRRTEHQEAQQQLQTLSHRLQGAEQGSDRPGNSEETLHRNFETMIREIKTVPQLKQKFKQLYLEKELAVQALQQERLKHQETRSSLTTVINDTIDQLTPQRSPRNA